MEVTLLKIELPKDFDWGIVQINNFSNTSFRFEIQDGKPVLDTSFFADQLEGPEKKHQRFEKDSELYIGIQSLLDDYYTRLHSIRKFKKLEEMIDEDVTVKFSRLITDYIDEDTPNEDCDIRTIVYLTPSNNVFVFKSLFEKTTGEEETEFISIPAEVYKALIYDAK